MSLFYFNFDTSELESLLNIDKVWKKATEEAAVQITQAAYFHLVEEAEKKLHTRKEMFISGLSVGKEEDVYFVNLDAEVVWINDGQDEHSMVESMLASSKAKKSKDGSSYLVVPFDFSPGQGPTKVTAAQSNLIATVKKELRGLEVPFAKIETDASGKPKTGLLHDISIMDKPQKTHQGPGQGKGAIGDVVQGPTGTPFLQNIRIYQQGHKNESGEVKVKRSILTFRTVSSKHIGTDKWRHPGLEATDLFKGAEEFAIKEWDKISAMLASKLTNL